MKRNHEKQKGAVMIMVTVIIAFSMLMLAFALDIGWILSTKSELQHGADSAALASVVEIFKTNDTDVIKEKASAWAAFNKAANSDNQFLDENEILIGYIHDPLDPESPLVIPPDFEAGQYYNAVQVRSQIAGTDEEGNSVSRPLDLFMEAFTDKPNVMLGEKATAFIDNRFFGSEPPEYGESTEGGTEDGSPSGSNYVFGGKFSPFTVYGPWWDFHDYDGPWVYGAESYVIGGETYTYEDRYCVDWTSLLEEGGKLHDFYDTETENFIFNINYHVKLDKNIDYCKSPCSCSDEDDDGVGDGIPEMALYPYKFNDMPTSDEGEEIMPNGNMGLIYFGDTINENQGSSGGATRLKSQIVNGILPGDYYDTYGDGKFLDPEQGIGIVDGDTGLKSSIIKEFEKIEGQIRFILLHSNYEGSGGTATYTITRLVPVIILEYINNPSGKDIWEGHPIGKEYVIVQPLKSGAFVNPGGSGSDYDDTPGVVFVGDDLLFNSDAPPSPVWGYALVR